MSLARGLAAAILLLATTIVWGDEAEDAFNAQFGNEVKSAKLAPQKVDLAARIVEAAQKEGVKPATAVLFCESAFGLVKDIPSGADTAAEAMELVADLAPEQRAAAWDKVVQIRRKQFVAAKPPAKPAASDWYVESLIQAACAKVGVDDPKAADAKRQALQTAKAAGADMAQEVEMRLLAAEQRHKAEKSVAELTAKTNADPKDAVSRNQLARILLVDLDDPKKANLLVNDSCDEALRKYLPAIMKPGKDVPELAALDLAKWYASLADETGKDKHYAAKGHMLIRARRYYCRYMEAHRKVDAAAGEVSEALNKIRESMGALVPAMTVKAVGLGRWVDLAKGVDPARDTTFGWWEGDAAGLTGSGTLALPCVLDGNYELSARYLVPEKPQRSDIILPIASARVRLYHSYTETLLLRSAREDSMYQDAQRLDAFFLVGGKESCLGAKLVRAGNQVEIEATGNGKPILRWKGRVSALLNNDDERVCIPNGPGLGAANCTLVVKGVKVRMLSGKVRLVR